MDLKYVSSWETSFNWKCGTNHGNEVYVGILFFCQLNNMCNLMFFRHIYQGQGHVWYHFGLPILRVCCLYTRMKKNLTPQNACERTSSLNLKLVCCKFQLYKCMYGLKCYQLYHVLPVCRLFPIKNVYSPFFPPTTSWSPVKIHVWQVLVCDASMMQKQRCFYKKTKKKQKKQKKLHGKKK